MTSHIRIPRYDVLWAFLSIHMASHHASRLSDFCLVLVRIFPSSAVIIVAHMEELSGQPLIDLAWSQQPIKLEGFAAAIVGFNCFFLLASAIAVSGRLWVRAWLYKRDKIWGWDDNLTVLSFVSITNDKRKTADMAREANIWTT